MVVETATTQIGNVYHKVIPKQQKTVILIDERDSCIASFTPSKPQSMYKKMLPDYLAFFNLSKTISDFYVSWFQIFLGGREFEDNLTSSSFALRIFLQCRPAANQPQCLFAELTSHDSQ